MITQFIKTNLGDIYLEQNIVEDTIPIIFLHGTYFDHHLWDYQISKLPDHSTITVDLPLHGKSKANVPNTWNFDDTTEMLIQILDELEIQKVIAIGQSWGSMVILRVADKYPERFNSIGFCNLPLDAVDEDRKKLFEYTHSILDKRKEFLSLANNYFFSKKNSENKTFTDYLENLLRNLRNEEIIRIDKSTSLIAFDARSYLDKLNVPKAAIVGKEDFVGVYEKLKTKIVKGGHLSPLEAEEEVLEFIINLIEF